jgi:hypothetical protein
VLLPQLRRVMMIGVTGSEWYFVSQTGQWEKLLA